MSCTQCNDEILNPTPPTICLDCPGSCQEKFDLECVIYNFISESPSNLRNLGLPNNTDLKTIIEQIDFLIGQNFNIDLTVIQSSSITLTATGAAKHTLKADVIVSPDAGNKLEIRANGLYVA